MKVCRRQEAMGLHETGREGRGGERHEALAASQ